MSLPFVREFRLGKAGGDGVHPYLTPDGAFHGNGEPLLEIGTDDLWRPRERRQLEYTQRKRHGTPIDIEYLPMPQ